MSPGLTRRIDRRFRPEASFRHRHMPDPAVFHRETAKAAGHPHSCFDPMPIDMRMHPPHGTPFAIDHPMHRAVYAVSACIRATASFAKAGGRA